MSGWFRFVQIAVIISAIFVFAHYGRDADHIAQASPRSPSNTTGETVAEQWKGVTIYMRPSDAREYEFASHLTLAVFIAGFVVLGAPILVKNVRDRSDKRANT